MLICGLIGLYDFVVYFISPNFLVYFETYPDTLKQAGKFGHVKYKLKSNKFISTNTKTELEWKCIAIL